MPGSDASAVVVTGCGWAAPFAAGGIAEVLGAGHAACHKPDQGYWPVSAEILALPADLPKECQEDDAARLAAVALTLARRSARVNADVDATRVGLVLGIAQAGQSGMIDFAEDVRQQSARFVSPIRFPQTVGNYVAGALARGFDIRGPNMTLASGLASGLDALVEAHALLSSGQADLVYAGGSERLTPALAVGLADAGVLFSDGACLLVLERESDAHRRGVDPVARLDAAAFMKQGSTATESVAGPAASGVIHVESLVGRCVGALGAAAVATAIGALRGLAVPVVTEPGLRSTCCPLAIREGGVLVRAMRRGGTWARLRVQSA